MKIIKSIQRYLYQKQEKKQKRQYKRQFTEFWIKEANEFHKRVVQERQA